MLAFEKILMSHYLLQPKLAERRVSMILSLRIAVRSLVAVCDAVEGSHSLLLQRIHEVSLFITHPLQLFAEGEDTVDLVRRSSLSDRGMHRREARDRPVLEEVEKGPRRSQHEDL